MVQEAHDGALAALITRAAIGAAVGALLLLALGLLAEILRRRHRAGRVLALLDLTVPIGVRTAIVSLLALLATFTGGRPVGADDSVRGWLKQTTSTTAPHSTPAPAPGITTTSPPALAAPPVVTPAPIHPAEPVPAPVAAPPTTVPAGPVVLIPPLTITRPVSPTTSTTTSRPRQPAPSSPTVPSTQARPAIVDPPASAGISSPELYVVQRDDCLWSIAARRLGSRADGRAIDTAWRQIYAANRAAIGDNPNLIHIGLTLALPPLTSRP